MERIAYGTNENQFGELRLPEGDGPHPVAVVIHGGFWKEHFGLEIMNDAAESLTSQGFATWNIEYRRVGQEGGAWPGTLKDAAEACDYLAQLSNSHSLDLSKVVTIGHSAGGHLALWLAGRHRLPEDSELVTSTSPLPIAAAVSLAGVNDLRSMYEVHHRRDSSLSLQPANPTAELLGGAPDEYPKRFKEANPVELLPLNVPQVIVHGSMDINVPVGISDHYYQMAENLGDFIKYVELPEDEHFMLTDTNSQAWETILEEMNLLKKHI
ncbi:MAG: alpha/beta fold hydrolase [Halobacillus sp.]|uniref:alpha/beta hydrolase family protein n=1 Tax=Halobacillus sp. TaxID=56800 RepID=UPI003BAEDC14